MTARMAWINGEWGSSHDAKISLSDRGLTLGDGIFETILILNGTTRLLANHLNRWEFGAAKLGMAPPPNEAWLKPIIEEGVHLSSLHSKNGVVRLNWSRGNSNNRGINISLQKNDPEKHRFWLEIYANEPSFAPISTTISKYERRVATSQLNQCKTFNYLPSIQARREAKLGGFDDALLLSTNGEICCGTTSNLIIQRKNEWLTPSLESGCLPGIMRQQGIESGLIKPKKLSPTPEEGDQWLLINSLSCHPIEKVNGKALKTLKNPKEFWLSLIEKTIG